MTTMMLMLMTMMLMMLMMMLMLLMLLMLMMLMMLLMLHTKDLKLCIRCSTDEKVRRSRIRKVCKRLFTILISSRSGQDSNLGNQQSCGKNIENSEKTQINRKGRLQEQESQDVNILVN